MPLHAFNYAFERVTDGVAAGFVLEGVAVVGIQRPGDREKTIEGRV